jgi:chromosome segregation ATPase
LAEEMVNTENVSGDSAGSGEVLPDRVVELERLVAQKEEELGKTTARIAELELLLADRNTEISALKKSEGELQEKHTATSQALTEAVAGYKTLVIQMNPGIMAELISGDSIETVNRSLEKARGLVGRVRQSMEKERTLARVPVGSPGRRSPDLSSLSPREKIQYAIGGKK